MSKFLHAVLHGCGNPFFSLSSSASLGWERWWWSGTETDAMEWNLAGRGCAISGGDFFPLLLQTLGWWNHFWRSRVTRTKGEARPSAVNPFHPDNFLFHELIFFFLTTVLNLQGFFCVSKVGPRGWRIVLSWRKHFWIRESVRFGDNAQVARMAPCSGPWWPNEVWTQFNRKLGIKMNSLKLALIKVSFILVYSHTGPPGILKSTPEVFVQLKLAINVTRRIT